MKGLRIYTLVASTALIALIVAACGGGEATTAPTATRATTAQPTSPGQPTTAATAAPPRPTAIAAPTVAPTATPAPVPTGQLRFAFSAIAGYGLLPGLTFSKVHMGPMFDMLLGSSFEGKLDGNGGFVTTWETSADGLKWTMKTRNGVVFHDGSAATANDLKYTLDFYKSPDSPPAATLSNQRALVLKQVDVVDGSTAVATLNSPNIFFMLDQLSNQSRNSGGLLLPKAFNERVGFREANKAPVGSGPFKYKSDSVNQELIMEAVNQHWLYGVPRFRIAQFLIVSEGSTREALFKAGSAEGGEINRGAVREFSAGFDITNNPAEKRANLALNETYRETFANGQKNGLAAVKVRQAMSLAIDRELIVKQFLGGVGFTSITPLLPKDFAFKPLPIPKQDIAQAKKLMAEAGFAAGFPLDMYVANAFPGLSEAPEIMEAIAVWWESIGIKVTRKPIDIVTAYLPMAGARDSFGVASLWGLSWGSSISHLPGLPPGVKYSDTRGVHSVEDPEMQALEYKIYAAKSVEEYALHADQRAKMEVDKGAPGITIFYGGASYAVKKGLGGEKWKIGQGSGDINLSGLFAGKGDISR